MHFPQYSSVCSRFGLNNISCVKNLPYLPFLDSCRSNSLIVSGKRNPNRLVDIWKMSVSSSPSPSLIFHPITTLRQHRCPATAMSLSRYGNTVVLLRQHCCPATATLLFCCGNIPIGFRWRTRLRIEVKYDSKLSFFRNGCVDLFKFLLLWQDFLLLLWGNIWCMDLMPFVKITS